MVPATSGVLAEIGASVANSQGPGQSGFWLLDRSADALTWRLALIDSASSSLDVLYYLWYGDNSGRLLIKRILRAADRGVKVRLLIDDLLMIGNEKTLVGLDQHPNLQLRLFNPKRQRKLGAVVSFLANFNQMNSRMHDKLMIADNNAAILGGRNIGDQYFGLSNRFNFHDLDVLGFGPVARQSSEMFDNFWNSSWVVSASLLQAQADEEFMAKSRERLFNDLQASDVLTNYSIEPQDWTEELTELARVLHYGSSEVIYDRIENGEIVRGMTDSVGQLLRSAENEINLFNAYIIPDQDFIDGLGALTGKGIHVRILTNSLASHDVPAVNAHYKKWRKPIIETGAELYELRSDPAISIRIDTPPAVSKSSGFHSKAFVVDGRKVFIGSMNFDPRSANINTEMGVTIDSPGLGEEIVRLANRDMAPENAWRVMLDEQDSLIWVNSDETVTRQPAKNAWQRVLDFFFGILPKGQF
jgi:putative cardiolipin synthase